MNALTRLGKYVERLGPMRGSGLAAHKWLGKLLNPDVEFIWGDLGEDALLWFYVTEVLSIPGPGFYVDVGCNHPLRNSNTYRFYVNGWHGLAIDADDDVLDLYRRVRPRDVAVSALVSDASDDMDFFVFEDSKVSSVEPEHVRVWRGQRAVRQVRRMHPRTLGSILDEHDVPEGFDILKIDVEGHDAAVLRSMDLDRYRPRVVMVEMHSQTVEDAISGEISRILRSHEYRMASFVGYNAIFIKR
jgi:FkbM family methyltransferase